VINRTFLLMGPLLAGLLLVPLAQATVNGNVALKLTFTTTAPGASTGVHVDVRLGAPVGSSHKPSPLTGAVIRLPKGTVINTAARPQCTAPDPAMQAAGTLACPSDSQVGKGSLEGQTGFGPPVDPLVGDDTIFNGDNELIEIVTPPGAPAPAAGVDHLTIKGNILTAHPPTVPGGPPDYETAIKRITFVIPAFGAGDKAYVTTPPTCPKSGHWRTLATFYFADGSHNGVTADIPCH
jgi:hypothetical protein